MLLGSVWFLNKGRQLCTREKYLSKGVEETDKQILPLHFSKVCKRSFCAMPILDFVENRGTIKHRSLICKACPHCNIRHNYQRGVQIQQEGANILADWQVWSWTIFKTWQFCFFHCFGRCSNWIPLRQPYLRNHWYDSCIHRDTQKFTQWKMLLVELV